MNELLKNLLQALKAQGIEIPEDKTGDVEGTMNALFGNYVSKEVEAKNKQLEKNKNDILEEAKKFKSRFGDDDKISRMEKLMQLMDEDDEAKMIENGDIDALLQKRFGKKEEGYQTAISNFEKQIAELNESINGYKTEKNQMLLERQIDTFAKGAKGFKTNDQGVMDLFKMVVAKDWAMNEEGQLQFKEDGRLTKDGKAFNFDSYIEEDIKKNYGFFFDQNDGQGAGITSDNNNPFAQGGSGQPNSSQNLNQMDRDNISDEEYYAARMQQLSGK